MEEDAVRGCEFCNVTLRPLRWYPYDKIIRELAVNVEIGKHRVICLHAEDVMLYGSQNAVPDDEKLLKLHELVMSKVQHDQLEPLFTGCCSFKTKACLKTFRNYTSKTSMVGSRNRLRNWFS